MSPNPQPTVAVAGGGLAGLAAACALSDAGFRVTLFEKRPFLGGRASSYEHPGTREVIDNCQHVLFRCCTNLMEFYRRIGVDQDIRWFDTMTFVEPGGRASVMSASPLPVPFHTSPSLFAFPFLTLADKLALGRAMLPLMFTKQKDDGRTFQQWLTRHGQTSGVIENFWKPLLISALSDDLDRVSVSAAAQIVRLFMKSPAARHMGVPTVPLTDLYNKAGDYIRARGGVLHLRTPLEMFTTESSQVRVLLRDQKEIQSPEGAPSLSRSSRQGGDFDFLVLALPFDALDRVLPQTPESGPLREHLSHFENSPITGIHLWFDRQISDLDHAVLLNRTIQWMFHKSRLQPMRSQTRDDQRQRGRKGHDFSRAENASDGKRASATEGSYIELVVSSSKSLIDKSRTEIVDLALAEVREFFPAARDANLVKSAVVKEVNATYSPRPGIDAHRPATVTPWPRVFLAGDWTATGWPATMEGAVRSGYLAAEALARAASLTPHFLTPDLSPTGLMRLFG
jgi:squalene-associated FAD-dependent desaturase